MPNGRVDDHLSSRSTSTLSWPMRPKVPLDSARGLKYLHEEMEFQVIFRDLKTSNILLDENWDAKLSDFGLARHGPAEGLTHVSTAVVGTLGYAALEYMQTGCLTASDISSDMVQKIVDSVGTGPPQPPLLHYRGAASDPGAAKRAKKGSLRRKLQEFGVSCRNMVWWGWKA